MENILNDMFYEIRRMSYVYDEFNDCLDGAPNGILGVQLLMGRLKGTTYSIVTNPETGERDYVKDSPENPIKIALMTNDLIDYVNGLIEKKDFNKKI